MPPPLRVLHLCGSSGTNSYFRCWADFGDRQRFDYRFATLEPEGALHAEVRERGLPAFSLNASTPVQKARAIIRLRSYLRAEAIQVVQTHLLDAAWVGATAARAAGTRLVVFTGHHSREVSVTGNWRLSVADALAARTLSHRIIAHCQDMRDTFVRFHRVPPDRIAVIPFPIERDRWRAHQGRRQAMRQSLGLEDRVVLGAAGRLFWVKDYPLMLRAFAKVARTAPRLALVIAGQGTERALLEKLASDLGLGDRVRFVGHRSDTPALFSAFDLFLHTSQVESFCQVIVEAFALGVPVVTSAAGVAPEIMSNDVNGRLFPPGDEAGLVDALQAMLAQQHRWPAMGEEGRRRVEAFAGAAVIPRYEDQYLTWLGEQPVRADAEGPGDRRRAAPLAP